MLTTPSIMVKLLPAYEGDLFRHFTRPSIAPVAKAFRNLTPHLLFTDRCTLALQWCMDFCSDFKAKYFGLQWGRE